MGKLYIFAIGGSGSRVLRSLTMLMALLRTALYVPLSIHMVMLIPKVPFVATTLATSLAASI